MNENVIISIRGQQLFDEQEPDVMELITPGRLEQTEDGFTLSYQESELTGLEGTTTVFRIQGQQVTLVREGEVNSLMVFEEGQRHLSIRRAVGGNQHPAHEDRSEPVRRRHRDRLCHRSGPRRHRSEFIPDSHYPGAKSRAVRLCVGHFALWRAASVLREAKPCGTELGFGQLLPNRGLRAHASIPGIELRKIEVT